MKNKNNFEINHSDTLCSTEFLDCNSITVQNFTNKIIGDERDPVKKIIKLYVAVRDKLRYEIYNIDMSRKAMKASSIIENGTGFCIHKSIVFAAGARYLGVPSRLVYDDVCNHISTAELRTLLGGDVFHYHAHTEVFLNEQWVKATPVFNLTLCYLFGVAPLDFDGVTDSKLQPFDKNGNKYIEFLHNHGTYNDFPYEKCLDDLRSHHPKLFLEGHVTASGNLKQQRNMELVC